ncbi:unnamed protein product [Bemisia tabaci]|uniref:Complex I-MNLL n=1 Tax=Bemisia tabaci TaxID=7038 RepID=A0A9P0F0K6_BEMTA|nr:unnamed protein product [Bemisia tabaci]
MPPPPRKHNLFGFQLKYYKYSFPAFLAVFAAGKFLDDKEKERTSRFRDKSAMFGGHVKPGDPPSWPHTFF